MSGSASGVEISSQAVAQPARVLLVEDELAIADAVRFGLSRDGYEVVWVKDGEAAVEAAVDTFDVVLLDLMLPGLSGFEVCRQIRSRSAVPVIMLTARSAEVDRVLGLELGADDYVLKPFSLPELAARVHALLRRRELDLQAAQAKVDVGDLHLDLVDRSARVGAETVLLTASEFRLLSYLALRAGRACSRSELTAHLWQTGFLPDARVCDTHVKNLRRKLEEEPARPRRLLTVQRVGYMLVAPDRDRA